MTFRIGTKEGKKYTQSQKDSTAQLGYPIAVANIIKQRDTTYHEIEILPKIDSEESPFVKRHKNKKLPNFKLITLDGKTIDNEVLKGKIVMINFWSTTCGPCIAEMPQLNQLKKAYNKEVVFLAPAPEDGKTVKNFLQKHSFDFIILPDAEKLFKDWAVEGYPKNFFINQKGIIKAVKEGTPHYRETIHDEWQISVLRDYSIILEELKKKEE